MFFLLRMAFWLGVVLILLPTGSSSRYSASGNEIGAADAISAASATVEDLRGFCTRQPGACTVGSHVATSLGYRAQAGAKLLYDLLTDALAPRQTGSLAATSARGGARIPTDKATPQQASQGTLTPNDLAPAWRGPLLRRDGARKDGKPAA